ncbi:tRNA lysidine(34) synthetase TilS [Roseimaritima sediminicola]|uniref:tRNA lysidine(34) synthetase TilS n=1 Tax=Roseimaritima sediminicola TaxID=2662066 RepID=UPI001298505D|nr:tRNA lysidine(34) synthetase TilS [Roseimaritima sediminicola]
MGNEKPFGDAFRGLCHRLEDAWPAASWVDVPCLVAVSGGADSVALLCAMAAVHAAHRGRGTLRVAHYHHGLRGAAADADADFVRRLAGRLQLPFVVGTASPSAAGVAVADEASLRELRYRFLGTEAHRCGARWVAVGHTREDNVETLLHQMLRGCGPQGLAGMPRSRELVADVMLIRPLLQLPRGDLRAALKARGQPWREDASNAQLHYKRNWLRHHLLPEIEQQYPGAGQRLAQTIQQQADVLQVLDAAADRWLEQCVRFAPGRLTVRDQSAAEATIVRALQKAWDRQRWSRGGFSAEHWQRIARAISNPQAPPQTLPGNIRLHRHGSELRLESEI